MNKLAAVLLATVMGGVVSVASAQSSLDPEMIGEMPDYPHTRIGPGSAAPMQREPIAPEMIGEMPGYPHLRTGPGSTAPMQRKPIAPEMIGEMPNYPNIGPMQR